MASEQALKEEKGAASPAAAPNSAGAKPGFLEKIRKNKTIRISALVVLLVIIVGGGYYWSVMQNQISTDQAQISAPKIDLSPSSPGILKELYVKVGDNV